MQLSKRFLKVIADRFVVTPQRLAALSKIDPRRIYVENIRALLGSTSWMAKLICDTAVRQGIFAKKIQILCPDGTASAPLDDGDSLPIEVRCWREVDGEMEEIWERTDHLDKIEFYELVRGTA
jgi:hypothetical protein